MPHYASYGVSGSCSRVNTHTAPFVNSYAHPMHALYRHSGYENIASCDPNVLEGPPVRNSGSSTKALNTPRFHGGYFARPFCSCGETCSCGSGKCSCGQQMCSCDLGECSCGARQPVRVSKESVEGCKRPAMFHYYGTPSCTSYAAHY